MVHIKMRYYQPDMSVIGAEVMLEESAICFLKYKMLHERGRLGVHELKYRSQQLQSVEEG